MEIFMIFKLLKKLIKVISKIIINLQNYLSSKQTSLDVYYEKGPSKDNYINRFLLIFAYFF